MKRDGWFWARVIIIGGALGAILWTVNRGHLSASDWFAVSLFAFAIVGVLLGVALEERMAKRGYLGEPETREEYVERYNANYGLSGRGIEGTMIHFPCPFCAASDWHVLRVFESAVPPRLGLYSTEPIPCRACGRSARYVSERTPETVTRTIFQVDGPPAPEWVPIQREETSS